MTYILTFLFVTALLSILSASLKKDASHGLWRVAARYWLMLLAGLLVLATLIEITDALGGVAGGVTVAIIAAGLIVNYFRIPNTRSGA